VPQGSVLGPLLFTVYVAPVGELIYSFGVSYHHFTDDLRLFVTMDAANTTSALDRLARCCDAVRHWFLENYLQLNADKSDVMILDTFAQLKSAAAVTTVDVASTLQPSAGRVTNQVVRRYFIVICASTVLILLRKKIAKIIATVILFHESNLPSSEHNATF